MAACPDMCVADPLERTQTAGPGESSSSSSSSTATGCHHFGVRSYLHHFYEECAASVWDRHTHQDFQSQRSTPCGNSTPWKVSLVLGSLVLAVGLVVFVVGCSIPSRIEAFGEGELLFVDRHAVRFNQAIQTSLQAGAGMLCLGGLVVAASLFVSAFSRSPRKEEHQSPPPPLQDRGRERRRRGKGVEVGSKGHSDPVTKPPTPLSSEEGVPVTLTQVESVQPPSEDVPSPPSHQSPSTISQ